MGILIRNTRIFDGRKLHKEAVDVMIEGDRMFLDHGGMEVDSEISGTDLVLTPGLVDSRVDYCEPGLEHKEDVHSGSRASHLGGATDVCLMPTTEPAIDSKALVDFVKKKAQMVGIHPMGSLSNDGKNLNELHDMHQAGAVAFNAGDFSPDANLLKKALEYVRPFNGLIVVTPLESSLAANAQVHENIAHLQTGLPSSPSITEELALRRDLEILRYTGGRLHVSGLSTAKGVEIIAQAKAEGLDVTAEVFLANLLYTEQDQLDFDSNYKVRPFLRSEEDREALRKGVLDGIIDIVSSDHRPQNIEEKECEFDHAGWGQAHTQYLVSVLLDIFGKDALEKFLPSITSNPRMRFGLDQLEMRDGTKGAFTLIDLGQTTQASKEMHASRSFNAPLLGRELPGRSLAASTLTEGFTTIGS